MKIGTRKSKMALAQTHEIIAALEVSHAGLRVEIAENDTAGDTDQTSKLLVHGGKGGAFVAGIREMMRRGDIHMAMHSLKDVPGNEETPGLVFGAYRPREDARDALVLPQSRTFEEFEAAQGEGFRIGTNSVRRAAQLRRHYPGVEIIHFRGAADTRIHKLDNGIGQALPDGGTTPPADGLIMAASGLGRVGLSDRISHTFETEDILPAATQGIVVVECVADDWATREKLMAISDARAALEAEAEREVLWALDGHCNSPIAVHARLENGGLTLSAEVLSLDGQTCLRAKGTGPADQPRALGRAVALDLIGQGALDIIERTRPA
ncbi:hydroxymethylbilane synthase [Hyphobacterium sp. HN65]|uniref:Hydroxymethylbilane synthase n=1 Tax=Hyphobacterium lacteum TaxID=3116575 RepID=A0ABU7LRT0_9PROT|nr:hydroxymethylbilane synthase [Hyphobacterium sp. HN65]MEE2526034.1 hydroxymethylbilane synthase [Hyphobacterium sp. HN65]